MRTTLNFSGSAHTFHFASPLLAVLALSSFFFGTSAYADPDSASPGQAEVAKEKAKASAKAGATLAKMAREKADLSTFLKAITLFKKANSLDPRPEYGCNIGMAYLDLVNHTQKKSYLPRAHYFLSRCIPRISAMNPAIGKRFGDIFRDVEERIQEGEFAVVDLYVHPKAATIRISSFAEDETFVGHNLIWLPFGKHTLRVQAPGFLKRSVSVEINSKNRIQRKIELEKVPSLRVKTEHPPTPEVIGAISKPTEDTVQGSRSWIWFAASGLLLASGGVFHYATYEKRAEITELESGESRDMEVSEFKTQRNITYSLYALGAITLAYGASRYYTFKKKRKSLSISPEFQKNGVSVWLMWQN